jgi:PAS domain S-box-containing protein
MIPKNRLLKQKGNLAMNDTLKNKAVISKKARADNPEAMQFRGGGFLKSPRSVLIVIMLSVFLCESIVMVLLNLFPASPVWFVVLADSILLIFLLFPLIYLYVYRPSIKHIIKHQQSENELNDKESQLNDLLSNIDAIVLEGDPLDIYYVGGRVERLLGYPREKWFEDPDGPSGFWSKLLHPDDKDKFEICSMAIKKGQNHSFEYRMKDSNGDYRWFYDAVTVEVEEGVPVKARSIIVDITDRKRNEEALRESEARLKAIFNATLDPIVMYNNQGHPVYLNAAFTEVFGWRLDELKGRRIPFVPATEKEIAAAKIDELYAGKPVRLDTKRITKQGDIIDVVLSSAGIKEPQGDYIGMVVNLTDITERKKLEAQFQQTQKMETIGTLAGGIAHDFNNILFPIVGYTEMLLEDIPKDSPMRSSLDEIYTGALRAGELVKQILTFSRQDDNKPKPIKMQTVIKEVLKLIRSTIPTTIEIKQDIRNDCGIINADPTQIHQVVMNLATNAYHALEDSGGELKVSLKEIELDEHGVISPGMKPGSYACLTVADTGVGMDKDLTAKIFDPFFTTKEKGKGTGMGLSVVHGIVKNAGGGIHVHSELGKGTEFHVYLPVMKSLSKQQETQSREPIQGGTERILLVDDEEAIVTMEKQMLERLGYSVVSRINSVEATEAFRADPDKFDMVITDMAMPNMSGEKLASELVKIRPDIPILLCTGFSERMPGKEAEALGIKGLLMKPIVRKDLAKKIREVLDNRES